jgi:SAM-dependent methyltransferase
MAEQRYRAGWSAVTRADGLDLFLVSLDQVHAGQPEDAVAYDWFAAQLDVQPGDRLLEVGCGLGGATRALAHLVGDAGSVTGLDSSETMIAEARLRSVAAGLPVAFAVADADALPFADDTFDGCWAQSLLIIAEHPRRVLAEMVRVARPGACVAVTAPDLGTLAVDSAYRDVTRRLVDFVCDEETNGWIGRQVPGLLHDLGCTDIDILAAPTAFPRYEEVVASFQRYAQDAQGAGVLSAAEAVNWLADLEERARSGRFCGACLAFGVAARKPRPPHPSGAPLP